MNFSVIERMGNRCRIEFDQESAFQMYAWISLDDPGTRTAFIEGLMEDLWPRGEEMRPLIAQSLEDLVQKELSSPSNDALQDAAPFPIETLPGLIRDYVSTTARQMGCDESMIATPLLSVLASAVGNSLVVQVNQTWTEPCIIWSAVVAEPGSLKTPALNLAVEPLVNMQTEAHLQFKKSLEAWKRQRGKSGQNVDGDKPMPRKYLVSDITIEALASRLEENPLGLLLFTDELGRWLGAFDRYASSRGSDAHAWTEMYNGKPLYIDRKHGDHPMIVVENASVSITGGIQPGTLARKLTDEYFESGLASRLLVCMPTRRPQFFRREERPMPDLTPVFRMLIEELRGSITANGSHGPFRVKLSKKAELIYEDFVDDLAMKTQMSEGRVAAMQAKIKGYALRLALVIHASRWASNDPSFLEWELDTESVSSGIKLARWFQNEAMRVYGRLGENQKQRLFRTAVEKIKRHGGGVTVREWQRISSHRNAKLAESELDDLARRGLGDWQEIPAGPRGGRPTRNFVLGTESPTQQSQGVDSSEVELCQ